MSILLTPKLDLIFKKLFAENVVILINLLNAVLGLPKKQQIRSVEVKNPIILPEEITQKFIVLDVLVTDKMGFSYEIEMQVRRYESYSKRALYYLSRIYAGQLDSGEDYEKLKPVIGIHFLDYELFPDQDDFRFRFEMRDVRYPELRLTDDMVLHIFDLAKFENMMQNKQHGNDLSEWLHFFNHAHEEDKTMRTAYTNPAIHKAFDILETLSADEKTRRLARIREDALRTERSELFYAEKRGREEGEKRGEKRGLEKGEKRGLEKGRKENAVKTAKKLLAMAVLPPDQIAQATGLDIEEIQNLRRKKKIPDA